LRNNSKSGIECLYKNPKSPENTPKNAKKQQSTETKSIVNRLPKYKLGQGPFFAFSLAGEDGSHPCHPSVMPLIQCISNMNSHKFF